MKKSTLIFLLIVVFFCSESFAQTDQDIIIFENSFLQNSGSYAGFRLEPPFESFKGRSKVIQTRWELNSANILNNPQLSIRINVDSLKTGIALADKYFKEVFMETKLFPEVIFTLDSIKNRNQIHESSHSKAISATFYGKLYFHGVSKSVSVPVSLLIDQTNTEIKSIQLLSEFEVLLSDYNVKVPENLKKRIGEKVTLFVSTISK